MNWGIFMAALIQIESGGDPSAIGDNGKAVGCLQIHPCVVEDVNRIYNQQFTLADRYNETKSKSMAVLYIVHYAGKLPEPVSAEVAARIWNGGPRGYEKRATQSYWFDVRAAMNALELEL